MKQFYKRFACLVLALVLLVAYVPDLTPKAQAITSADTIKQVQEIADSVFRIKDIDMRLVWAQIELIGQKVALEQKITAAGLSGVALAKAKVILLELEAKIAASGISAATCANFCSVLFVAGIVIEFTDWGNVWDAVFNGDKFFEEEYIKMVNPVASGIVNFSNIDEKYTALVKAFDVNGVCWDYDYIESTNAGWGIISDWVKGIFGSEETGKLQALPPLNYQEILSLSNCVKVHSAYSPSGGNYDVYTVPLGWGITSSTGNFRMQAMVNGYYCVYGTARDGTLKYDFETGATIKSTDNCRLLIRIYTNEKTFCVDRAPNGVVTGGYSDFFLGWDREPYDRFFIPQSPPYTNRTGGVTGDREVAIEDLMPDVDDEDDVKIRYPLPDFAPDPDKTDEENLVDYIKTFPGTVIIPQVVGVPTPSPTPKPDTGTPTEPEPDPKPEDPEDPTKKKLDFSPLMSFTGLTNIFPFCLPFDYIRLIKTFNAPRKLPIFDLKLPLVKGHVFETKLDLSVIDPIMSMVRMFILLGFGIALISKTSKFIKW